MLTNWNRILIIKLRAIGDVILTTPVFENLRNSFPNSQIDFIVEKPSASLVAEDKNINSILIAPSGKDRKFKNDWQFFRKIRKQKYDVCIDLFGNPRSAIITLFSNAKLRVGYSYRGRKYAYQEKFSSNVSQIHEVEFNLDAVRHFDIPIVTKQPKIYLRDLDLKTAQKIIDGLNYSDKSIIALNPCASWPAKMWPTTYFTKLAKIILKKYDVKFIVLWGPREKDVALELKNKIGENAKIHPPTTLTEQAALLSLCDLFIGNDTGPMHLSAAVGIPTLGIFGPTNAKLQGPFGENTKAVFNPKVECLGCDKLECPSMDCMNLLSPEMVFEAVEELYAKHHNLVI